MCIAYVCFLALGCMSETSPHAEELLPITCFNKEFGVGCTFAVGKQAAARPQHILKEPFASRS